MRSVPDVKRCNGPGCRGVERPATDFNRHKIKGIQDWCRRCQGLQNLLYKYGVDGEWYSAKLEEQEGTCAICFRSPEKLNVDHDHQTGAPRGLLCTQCNTAFALIDADSRWLVAAENYRLRHLRTGEVSSTPPPTSGTPTRT